MKIEQWKTLDIIPYENNPRVNDMAVNKVAMSLEQYGWQQPLVVDSEGIVIAGHTRLKAAMKLGMETCTVVVADKLTPEQVRAYRIADNRTGELAEWDHDKLVEEIQGLHDLGFDVELTGFSMNDLDIDGESGDGDSDENYSRKIEVPIYEPKGEKPLVAELLDRSKTNKLIAEIDNTDFHDETKQFLRDAAERHTIFNFRKVADFYAHSDPAVQNLMEKSALVIIDMEKGIENGFVTLTQEISKLYESEYGNE